MATECREPKTKIVIMSHDLKKKVVQNRLSFLMERIINDFDSWLRNENGEEELNGLYETFLKLRRNPPSGIDHKENVSRVFNEMINQLDKELQTKEVLLCTSLVWAIASLFQEMKRINGDVDAVKKMESFLRKSRERELDWLVGRVTNLVNILAAEDNLEDKELFYLSIDLKILFEAILMQKKQGMGLSNVRE